MVYYLIIALQGFCIYHTLKNKNDYYWIFLILFIPVIGSIIYLVTQVYNKNDFEKVQDGLTAIINPTKKVITLQKQLEFSETFQNKINLADAYFEIRDYTNAITYYENAKESLFSEDFYLSSQLVTSYFYVENYDKVITMFHELEEGKGKISAANQIHYGLALDKLKKPKTALKVLQKINTTFSNYKERLILAEFLIDKGKKEEARTLLEEIYDESKHFTKDNKRIYKQTIAVVKSLLKE